MKFVVLILMFLIIGALFIISEKNLYMNKVENRGEFFKSYISWLNNLKENSKNIVGYVAKLEWLPKE